MKALIVLLWSMLIFTPALAQKDCGDGLPCGALPWDLPVLPVLPSPTPMPTVAITAVPPTATIAPTAGPTPTPTITPIDIDVENIEQQIATLQAIAFATQLPVMLEGTPVAVEDAFVDLGTNSGQLWGYVLTLTNFSFGKFSPLLAFTLLALAVVFAVKIATFVLPLLIAVVGILRKVITFILEFIPL